MNSHRTIGFSTIALVLLLCVSGAAGAAIVRYVKGDATGMNTGLSWIDAYTDLQTALAETGVDEVWVARGIYCPSPTDPNIAFQPKPGTAIFGGFAGYEILPSDRDLVNNITILSGNIGAVYDPTDNSLHVIVCSNYTVVDGVTVEGAYGSGLYANTAGTITIRNCSFKNNRTFDTNGGGVYLSNTNATIPLL